MHKKEKPTAYDLSKTKYSMFKGTINLLVENYLIAKEQKKVGSNTNSRLKKCNQESQYGSSEENSSPGPKSSQSPINKMYKSGSSMFMNKKIHES